MSVSSNDISQWRVSVVVPTYRRPQMLRQCLNALFHQSLPRSQYEIVVCDDGADPIIGKMLERLARDVDGLPLLRYLPVTETQGPAAARNVGWRAAHGSVIAFTDDDTQPEPTWLEAGLRAIEMGNDAVVGRLVMPLPERPSDYERDASRLEHAEFVTANCFVRRDVLNQVNGFDERYRQAWREDSDLHFKLLESGFQIGHEERAVVIHPLRPAPFAAGLKMQKKVMFDILLYRKHRRLYRQRIRKRPPWFYLLVTATLCIAIMLLLLGMPRHATQAALLWLVLTAGFFVYRLRGTVVNARNVGELLLTSPLIPPLSIFWRMVGIVRFGWVGP